MGIYDRDYLRREGPSFLGALSGRAQVCKWLIAINVVCFLLQFMGGARGPGASSFSSLFWLDPDAVLSGQVWRLVTYAFLHDPNTWLHIVFNMLFLWWFGADIEDIYGSREFLSFYMVSAFLGGVAFMLWSLASEQRGICIGASGAVTAVLVLYAMHFPHRRIYIWGIFPLPIWAFVGFQVAQDTLIFVGSIKTSTAVVVHLAGAAFAAAYALGHWRMMNLWSFLLSWQRRSSRPSLRVYPEEPVSVPFHSAPTPLSDATEDMEAKVDAILEKVAQFGQESLSDSERELLLRASEVYKRRRS